MDDISSLENLESVLRSKFKDELTIQISETSSNPFLVIRQIKNSDLAFVPSFHLVAVAGNADTQFFLKLLSFHGKVLVRTSLLLKSFLITILLTFLLINVGPFTDIYLLIVE